MVVLASLPIAHFVAIRPIFLFPQAQFVQVFPLKLAPFCMLSAGSDSTNKSAIYLFLFIFATLCSPSFTSNSGRPWQELSFLTFFTMRLQWVPGHSFFPGCNMVDDVAKRGALLLPCAISCALCLSPHTSRIHSLSFL